METSLRRGGIDVPEPVRRFLQGETEGWLRVEEHRDRNSLVVRTDLPYIDGVLGIRVRLPENSGKPAATVHVSRGGNQLPDAPENYLT